MNHRFVTVWFVAGVAALGFACSSPEENLARHLERADAYQESAQIEKALLELQSALKLDPQSTDTNLRIAELLERNEQFDEALFYYEEAYRLDPSRDEGALGLARLLRIAEPDRATELIDQVLERNPSSA